MLRVSGGHRCGARGPSPRWTTVIALVLIVFVGGLVAVPLGAPVGAAVRDPFTRHLLAAGERGDHAHRQLADDVSDGAPTGAPRRVGGTADERQQRRDQQRLQHAVPRPGRQSPLTPRTRPPPTSPCRAARSCCSPSWCGAAGETRAPAEARAGAGASARSGGGRRERAAYTTLTSTNTVAPDLGGTDGHPYQASIDVTAAGRRRRQRHVLGGRHPPRPPAPTATPAGRWCSPTATPPRRCATCRSSRASPTSPRPPATTA